MYPNKDAPHYVAGFSGTLAVLVVCVVSYLTLPLWLLREANARKRKTGHAMPLQAMEDAENSQISDAALARMHEINIMEEEAAVAREEMKGDMTTTRDGAVEHMETEKRG